MAGQPPRARALLEEAAGETDDPLLRADIDGQRGMTEMWGGNASEARRILARAAEQVTPHDPGRGAGLLVAAGLAAQMAGDVEETLAAAWAAATLEPVHPGLDLAVSSLLFNSLILAGESVEAEKMLARLLPLLKAAEPSGDDIVLSATMGHGLVWIERYGDARALFERQLESARAVGSLGLVPFLVACLSELDYRLGNWNAAYAQAVESARLAEETGQQNLLTFSLVTLGRVEAARAIESCRSTISRGLELADVLGAHSITVYGWSALGLLELGLGRVEQASERLLRLAALVAELGLREPSVDQWRPDLIEALALAGRSDEARVELAVLEKEAERTGRSWALGAAARCRGMLAEDVDLDAFEEALGCHRKLPFERARTELRLGERLRRARRSIEAREPLRSALSTFEQLGAAAWAERARAELAATGERRRRMLRELHELTAQELRIALLVADGATNREVAGAVFLSPKTVGYHLAKVYEKLGIHSRTQLAGLVARGVLGGRAAVVAHEPKAVA
ncbi:MAG: hypothetical protein H0V45_01925 [Actinobacteria bacterium]|nr:hypothetical protein [Actinomycetota bacterium]